MINLSQAATPGISIAVALLAWVWAGTTVGSPADFVRQMNLGKAYLENRNSAKAIEAFATAVKLEPKSAPALRNLARAQMLANQNDEAFKQLTAAQTLEKDSAATSYLFGLVRLRQSRFEEAVSYLETAVRLDPETAALRFQLANAYQVARLHDKAITQLRETVRLDPLQASAHFKLAAYAVQAENKAEFDRHQNEFMRLRRLFGDETRTPAALERCLYTQPEPAPGVATRPSPGIPVRFVEASNEVFPDESARAATAVAVLDVDEKGVCRVFTVDGQGAAGLLTMELAGKLARTPVELSLTGPSLFHQCIVGDFYNDVPKGVKYDPSLHALNDVLLVGSNAVCLLKRTGAKSFTQVTESAGLARVAGRRAQWVDYDHDGDLDLLLAATSGLQLWQNNGDGHFTNVTSLVGLSNVTAAVDVAAVDLDNNVAMDMVAARGEPPTLVFMNQRTGQFAPLPEPPGPWPAARRVLADDLDNDGNPDVLLLADQEAVVLFGKRARRQRLDLSAIQDATVALLDFDNDGWLDICVAGAKRGAPDQGAVRLWRNTGGGNWIEVTETAGLALLNVPPVREIVAADLDNDGDTDLLLVTATGRLHFLRNEGGNVNRQLKLRLVGLKTNPTALGTQVEVRADDFRATRAISKLPIEIGVGSRQRLDSLQMVWGNGIVDNQIEVPVTREPLTIVEKNVAAGSCPYLYAWDGHDFRFVTDLLGNSPVGLSLRRGVMMPAKPDEIVLVGNKTSFRPRRGYYELEVTDELREVLYLDQARLLAVDHPSGVEVHSTDKLAPPPFAPSELWALQSPRVPLRATGDDGLDRTEALRAVDGVFAPPGLILPPPLRGMCHPLALTLDFGPLDAERLLVLALTGWLQYGDASANIAASQNAGLAVVPPKLEVETRDRVWQLVDIAVGMPSGKTKTIVADLTGKLPRGARRLRLTTTFEIRWDRIAMFERAPATELRRHELAPVSAQLHWRGFSEIKSRALDHPQTPAYGSVSDRPSWRTTPQGWCTRYGDVLDLVKARDDRLVILNAGDALKLRFRAQALPPVPQGFERTFFFYCVGWDKDEDHNVVAGNTVEPLPAGGGAAWCLEYNTRWVPANRFGVPASAGRASP